MPSAAILLVEDNDDNRRIYSTILTFSGYHVIEATDGEEALAAARAHLPAIILLDIAIPKVDGWEVTRRLKADPLTSGIPIVALTAHALAADRAMATEVGCDGYISKPAEPRTVLEEVRQRIGSPTPA